MKKLKNIRENSERRFTELMNKISEQKQHFTKEIETVKKSQTNSGAEELNTWDGECIGEHWRWSSPDGRESLVNSKIET